MTSDRFVVAGGGIAGLAAAWELVRRRPGASVVVHEPGRIGGKLRTSVVAGRLVDEGADAFLARVPWGRELCDELGLGDALVSPAARNAYLARGEALDPMPTGTVLGVPVDASSFAGSVRAAVEAEPSIPGAPLAPDEDVSVGDLVRRRYGQEVLDRLVDPLLGGINAGDSDRLSLRAAAPQIAAAAERSASLVEGLRATAAPGVAADRSAPVFWALPAGMASLVDALEAALRAAGVELFASPLEELGPEPTVLAVPAPAAAALLGEGEAATLLRSIGHASPVLTTMAFRRSDIRHPLDASGLLVPRVEGRLLTACTFATTKWAHLDTGDGTVLLRASAGRYGDDRAIDAADDDLVARLLDDLDALLGLAGAPTEVRINRWRDGFPQYEPGHLAKVAAIESALPPNVRLAGAPYRGIGIPACIKQGREAAASLRT